MTTTYNDLIYYKDDIIKEYSKKRKNITEKEVEDLLRCALLFLESETKKKEFTSIEIPNIGYLHRKIDFKEVSKQTKRITKYDNFICESAYIDTKTLPIILRQDLLDKNYPGLSKEELQKLQNSK